MDTTILLRAEQVAKVLGVCRSRAYGLMASGELPVIRIGTSVRVPADALQEWIKQRVEGNREGPSATTATEQR